MLRVPARRGSAASAPVLQGNLHFPKGSTGFMQIAPTKESRGQSVLVSKQFLGIFVKKSGALLQASQHFGEQEHALPSGGLLQA